MFGLQEGWIREKEQILSSEDYGKDLTGALRLLSQHKAFEDEMSGRAAHLQQTIKQGEELVANDHFGADKIKERIQDIQVTCTERFQLFTCTLRSDVNMLVFILQVSTKESQNVFLFNYLITFN